MTTLAAPLALAGGLALLVGWLYVVIRFGIAGCINTLTQAFETIWNRAVHGPTSRAAVIEEMERNLGIRQ